MWDYNSPIRIWPSSIYDSQPMPSLSQSNPSGSGDKTLKRLSDISPQLRSGELDGIHISGYQESQSSLSFSELVCILGKKTNGRLASNIIVDNEIIIFAFILAIVKL